MAVVYSFTFWNGRILLSGYNRFINPCLLCYHFPWTPWKVVFVNQHLKGIPTVHPSSCIAFLVLIVQIDYAFSSLLVFNTCIIIKTGQHISIYANVVDQTNILFSYLSMYRHFPWLAFCVGAIVYIFTKDHFHCKNPLKCRLYAAPWFLWPAKDFKNTLFMNVNRRCLVIVWNSYVKLSVCLYFCSWDNCFTEKRGHKNSRMFR